MVLQRHKQGLLREGGYPHRWMHGSLEELHHGDRARFILGQQSSMIDLPIDLQRLSARGVLQHSLVLMIRQLASQ